MKKITLSLLALTCWLNVFSQSNWTLSMTGYDLTYSPADFVTADNGDIYVNGVKYDNGISGFINKLYKSTDQGASWAEVSTTGLADLGNVHSLTISGNKMILGGMNVNSANGAKIYTSTDNGASWTLSMTGYDITYSPADFVTADNGDVYVNGVKYDNGISGYINKLFKSTDQGASWSEVSTSGLNDLGNVLSIEISGNKMILSGQNVVTTNADFGKIYTSSDNGSTWNLSITGFDESYSASDFITADNGDVYVNGVKYDNGISGFINKLYKSSNQGASWTEVTTTGLTDLGNVHSVTISGNKMILGGMDVNSTNGAKIYRSDFDLATTINESFPEIAVDVFPNPFTDAITLRFTESRPYLIRVFSVTGKLLIERSGFNSSSVQLDAEKLQSGLYIIVLNHSEGTQSFRVLKE